MVRLETRTAALSAKDGGIENETGEGFRSESYRAAAFHSIPSPECSDRLALVVRRGDRLFAIGPYREGTLA